MAAGPRGAVLVPVDDPEGRLKPVPLPPGQTTVVGRGPQLGISDVRVSRRQLEVQVGDDGRVLVRMLGPNKSAVAAAGGADAVEMQPGQAYPLEAGAQLWLLPRLYRYRLSRAAGGEPETGPGSEAAPEPARKRARHTAGAPGEDEQPTEVEQQRSESSATRTLSDEELARQLHAELNADVLQGDGPAGGPSPPRHRHRQTQPRSPHREPRGPAKDPRVVLGFRNNVLPHCSDLGNAAACSLADVVEEGVQEVWAMNYMWDLDFLFKEAPPLARVSRFLIILDHRYAADCRAEVRAMKARYPAIEFQVHCAPLSDRFGTHHSKAMLLFYPTGLRVMVATANFIPVDWHALNQGIWTQDFPCKGPSSPPSSEFEQYLTQYLNHCGRKLFGVPTSNILDTSVLRRYDFSGATVHLVASVPGTHTGSAMQQWGQGRLRHLLEREGPPPARFRDGPVVLQFSSMGSLHPNFVFGQLLRTMSGQASPKPTARTLHVVYPTVAEVRQSIIGYPAGGSLPATVQNWERAAFLRPHLCTWRGADGPPTLSQARQQSTPHIKTYLRYNAADPDDLQWLLLTSCNLSKAAWGEEQKGGSQLKILSYELGVLFLPSLYARHADRARRFSCTRPPPAPPGPPITVDAAALHFRRYSAAEPPPDAPDGVNVVDTVYLPLPYQLPPTPYASGANPWAVDQSHTQPDHLGQTWLR